MGKWKADERLVLETIENINDELRIAYDHSIDTIDPDEPSDLPGSISDEEAEWLEEKVLTSMGV